MNSQASAHIQLCGSRDDIAGLLAGSEFKSTPARRARQARGDDSRVFWQRVHESWDISARVRGVAQRDGPPALTGGASDYEVLPGDYLEKIGARYGVAADTLAKDNGIADPDVILPGKRLRVDHPHIVPEPLRDGIVINLPQRMLFFFRGGELAAAYPVGLGRPSWPTVQGTFHFVVLEKNLIWDCRNRSRKIWRARARSYAA